MASETESGYLRTIYFLSKVGTKAIWWAFSKEFTDKIPTECFIDYLVRSKPGWDAARTEKCFNPTLMQKMNRDPTCKLFDISLYCQIFRLVVGDVVENGANAKSTKPLKNKMKIIKDIRNTVFHQSASDHVEECIESCRRGIFDLIDCIAETYDVPATEKEDFIHEMEEEMKKVTEMPLTMDQLIKCSEESFQEIICDGVEELNSAYKKWSRVDPVFFLGGWDFDLEVDAVFTDMIVMDAGNRILQGRQIDSKDILSSPEKNIVLVEGQAGAGKSTLLKYLLSKWATGKDDSMKRLTDFDILIFFECRNSVVSSLQELLVFLLPTVSKRFSHLDLMKCILDLQVLFLVDGLDEINETSLEVVRQIMYAAKRSNINVMFTSRPSHIEKFYHLRPAGAKTRHIRLDGIPAQLHGVFVGRLHRNLCQYNNMTQNHEASIEQLVQYIEDVPKDLRAHFQFPLNLTLITILWIYSPATVHKVSSITTLYTQILILVNEKLQERLLLNKDCERLPSNILRESTSTAYKELCKQSFVDLKHNSYVINKDCLRYMSKLCGSISALGRKVRLPADEVLGAYLAVKHTWTSVSGDVQYSYPHRSFQEHMAATHFCSNIVNTLIQKEKSWMNLFKSFKEEDEINHLLSSSSLKECGQNFFLHLAGVMHLTGVSVLRKFGPHVILYVARNLNPVFKWWFTFLREAQSDPEMLELVCVHLPKFQWAVNDEELVISDLLMNFKVPEVFSLAISRPPDQCALENLAVHFSRNDLEVELDIGYSFRNPLQSSNDATLQGTVRGRSKLLSFSGHLKDPKSIDLLPSTVESLEIAVVSSEAYKSLIQWPHLNKLVYLALHIDQSVPLDILVPLPSKPGCHLYLSGVTDDTIHWAVTAALLLQPSREYFSIWCYDLHTYSEHTGEVKEGRGVTTEGLQNMIESLEKASQGTFALEPQFISEGRTPILSCFKWTVFSSDISVETKEDIKRPGSKTTMEFECIKRRGLAAFQ